MFGCRLTVSARRPGRNARRCCFACVSEPDWLPCWQIMGGTQMKRKALTRRRFVATSAAASATMLAAPFVKSARAAGKLSVGLWDHWVPGANKTSEALVHEWAAKEKVEVTIDYITGQGNKLLLTASAEAQAKSGHDILAMSTW